MTRGPAVVVDFAMLGSIRRSLREDAELERLDPSPSVATVLGQLHTDGIAGPFHGHRSRRVGCGP